LAFNSTIAGIERADAVLLVGSNIRWEAPLIATRIRKVARKGGKIFAIGPEVDLGMKVQWLGEDLRLLGKLPKDVTEAFAAAQYPALVIGPGALAAGGLGAALSLVEPLGLLKEGWNGFNVVHTSASRMAGLVLGFAQPAGLADVEAADPHLVLLLGADEVAPDKFKRAYKIYIGHHGDNGARMADLVLPGAAYAEKHGTYVNTEGRVQRGEKAAFPPGDAREDWAILRAVSELNGKPLPFDTFDQLRTRMLAEYPQLGRNGLLELPWSPPQLPAKAQGAVRYAISDFYLTNAICRSSPTMHRCSEELVQGLHYEEAAE
jgi:NADH-quinone oxidoreductase subunit G